MTLTPLPGSPEDLARPRPVRVTAFLGTLAQGLLVVLALALRWDGTLVAALVGVIAILSMAGWLFVERHVTPMSDPRDGHGRQLVPAATPPQVP